MDRFKFRVWRIKENCYNHQEPFPTCCMQENGLLAYFHEERQMQNYIVEQCTGLKDKNGKLIYEGDIVEFYSYSVISALTGESMKRRVGIVVWNDEMLKFDITVNGEAIPDLCKKTDDNQFVIIGNIHENKDLLGADND